MPDSVELESDQDMTESEDEPDAAPAAAQVPGGVGEGHDAAGEDHDAGEAAHDELMALQRRALSMDVDVEAVEDAMDADDTRSALTELIVHAKSTRGVGGGSAGAAAAACLPSAAKLEVARIVGAR
jgi:hypothetical protein